MAWSERSVAHDPLRMNDTTPPCADFAEEWDIDVADAEALAASLERGDYLLISIYEQDAWVCLDGFGVNVLLGFVRSVPVPQGYVHNQRIAFTLAQIRCRVPVSKVNSLLIADFERLPSSKDEDGFAEEFERPDREAKRREALTKMQIALKRFTATMTAALADLEE